MTKISDNTKWVIGIMLAIVIFILTMVIPPLYYHESTGVVPYQTLTPTDIVTSTPIQTSTPTTISTVINPSGSSNKNCVIGTWKLDRQVGRTDDILTWNFYSDGTFKDIHYFSDGHSQAYDWGTWQYLGNTRYVVQETSTTMHVDCNNGELIHEESTNDVFHQS